MKLSSPTALGLAALATLRPETLKPNAVATNTISQVKRDATPDKHYYCNDYNWKNFGERAFLAGTRLIGHFDDGTGKNPNPQHFSSDARAAIQAEYLGTPGWCTQIWCGGNQKKGRGVVFYLCQKDGTEEHHYLAGDLGKKYYDGFTACNNGKEPEDDKTATNMAFHVREQNFTLSVEGGYDDMDCPGVPTNRFVYPTSFSQPPYI